MRHWHKVGVLEADGDARVGVGEMVYNLKLQTWEEMTLLIRIWENDQKWNLQPTLIRKSVPNTVGYDIWSVMSISIFYYSYVISVGVLVGNETFHEYFRWLVALAQMSPISPIHRNIQIIDWFVMDIKYMWRIFYRKHLTNYSGMGKCVQSGKNIMRDYVKGAHLYEIERK
jgi:hypothetical protein